MIQVLVSFRVGLFVALTVIRTGNGFSSRSIKTSSGILLPVASVVSTPSDSGSVIPLLPTRILHSAALRYSKWVLLSQLHAGQICPRDWNHY